jgi:putative transposase
MEEFLHSIPGTTFSKFYKREFYKSEKFAVLTIQQLNWIIAKWVIDVYHQNDHSKIPYPPAEMWSRSVKYGRVAIREAPKKDFEALMGVVVNRCLRRGGVKYLGLRWDSKAFANLRGRLPHDADVPVRIDPRDLKKAYVWDERNEKWVTGNLKEPMEAAGYSLDQWFFIDFNRKENEKLHGMSRNAAIAKAIADIQEFIDGIRDGYKNSNAYRRYLEFTSKGLSAWEAVAQPVFDPDEDGPMKPHKPGVTEVLAKPAETGPYRDDNPPPHPPKEEPDQARQDGEDDGRDDEEADGTAEASPQPTKPKRAARQKSKSSAESQTTATIAEPTKSAADDDEFKDDDFSGPFTVRSQSDDE